MTEKARRQDGEEAREERESLPAELAHELAPERDTQRDLSDLTGAAASERDDVPTPDAAIAGATESTESTESAETTETTERPRARRASHKASIAQTRATEDASENATADATTEATGVTAMSALDADRIELEAQGFSADEADRLIEVSKRLESSAEALASQAELKRLRFAQWLIERGILDEFSV